MITFINTKLRESRGVSSIWLEGGKLGKGFQPEENYRVEISKTKRKAELISDENGNLRVSTRNRNGRTWPLIELRDERLGELFEKGVMLRVVVREGRASIEVHGNDRKAMERVERFISKTTKKEPLAIGSLFSGGGILDRALHEGLSAAGVDSYTKFAVELEGKYLDAMLANQPDLFREDSILIESAIENVELRNPPQVEFLFAGIPCTGASKAGKTSNKIKAAEFHDAAGACFFHALGFIGKCQPTVVVIENVPDYLTSTSMAVIRSVLYGWGYELSETVLNGNQFGSLENRDRMCLVATTKGLPAFDLQNVVPLRRKAEKLSDVLEYLPLDHKSWREYTHLKAKEESDAKAGKGFKRAMYQGDEGSVSTIRRLYHKAGSCDQYLVHPENPELSRLFTPKEHARIKGVPLKLIEGVANTTAHEILGQSVCFPVFESVGVALGCWGRLVAGEVADIGVYENSSVNNGAVIDVLNDYRDHVEKIEFDDVSIVLFDETSAALVA